jgi:hypothetical protein
MKKTFKEKYKDRLNTIAKQLSLIIIWIFKFIIDTFILVISPTTSLLIDILKSKKKKEVDTSKYGSNRKNLGHKK